MMPSAHFPSMGGLPHAGYAPDVLYAELSRHFASHDQRRLAKGHTAQQPRRAGTAARISKPSSASHSPRDAIKQQRRRALLNDMVPNGPRAWTNLPTPATEAAYYHTANETMNRPARPVSWHPSTHQLLKPQQYSQLQQFQVPPQQLSPPMQCPVPSYFTTHGQMYPSTADMSPTQAVYSGYPSPASVFSPLSAPYSTCENQMVAPSCAASQWGVPTQVPALEPSSAGSRSAEPSAAAGFGAMPNVPCGPSSLDWNTFAGQGFDRCTAPPTPETVSQVPAPQVKIVPDESVPYGSLEDDDPKGEVLYGMGLYDAPNQPPVMSLLNGLPTGKGLKLEDSWEPPASDDEDGEGEADEADQED